MSKQTTTYTHRTANGEVHTVNSTRTYTHVIVCGDVKPGFLGGCQHGVCAWSGSEAAALRRVSEFSAVFEDVRVEPINNGHRA